MSAIALAPIGQISLGYYGNLTAAINSGRPNHLMDSSIYGWLNCLTSLPAILLGSWGCFASLRDGLPKRYAVGYLGLVFIGVGSLGLHSIMELSKTYFASYVAYLLLDSSPSFQVESLLALGLAAWNVLLSVAHLLRPNLVHHYIVLTIVVLLSTARCLALVRTHGLGSSSSDKTAKIGTLFWATNTLILGSVSLKVDDLLYERLRGVREALGPLGFMLRGQAGWDLLSAYGIYLAYTSCIYLALTVKTSPGTFDYDASAWFPTCYRVAQTGMVEIAVDKA